MNRLEQFLSEAARQMRIMPAAVREDELRELRGHLEQRAQDYEDEGMSADEAQVQATAGLGSPRALGSRLCDAWEGIAFSWWQLAAAIAGATAFWLVAQFYHARLVTEFYFWPQKAMVPGLVFPIIYGYFAIGLVCGVTFSLFLGRRGKWASLLFFAASWALSYALPQWEFFLARQMEIEIAGVPVHSLLITASLAFAGAVLCDGLRQRKRRIVIAGARLFSPSDFEIIRPRSRARWGTAVAGVLCVVAGLLLWNYGANIYAALHPQTPRAMARAAILTQTGRDSNLQAPTILELRELPPASAAERLGTERRFHFKAELRATDEYAARRAAYIQKMLSIPSQRKSWGEEPLRLSLKRMQRNRQEVEGEIRVVNTPEGWQLDEKSFDDSQFRAWAYDIYYER